MDYFSTWEGVFYWKAPIVNDSRGAFSKLLPKELLPLIGDFFVQDLFITESDQGVVRGIHLQYEPYASARLIHVISGSIDDILIDLRPKSTNYRSLHSQHLGSEGLNTVFIPPLVAHGFEALTATRILYIADKVHDPNSDAGFNPLSIEHNWKTMQPTISDRDLSLPKFYN